MPTRAEVVAEAREWIGTPFVHQGRVKGVAADCVGLVIGVARRKELSQFDIRNYPARPNPTMMRGLLDQHLVRISFKQLEPADLVYFRVVHQPQHLAIVSQVEPLRMIHAYSRENTMRCVEQDLTPFWRQRVDGCYRFPVFACN